MKQIWFVGAIGVVLLASCGGASGDSGMGHDMGMNHDMGSVPGTAAAPADATREVIIKTTDEPAFDPSTVSVSTGEVVTFVIKNVGNAEHEFVLGDEAYQDMHGDAMEHEDMGQMDNAVTVAPGATAELTWKFDDAGEVLYGCHEPGHYEDGMVGTISVE